MIGFVLAAVVAAPTLHVSQVADLAEGQRISVTGSGFRPGLKSVAVGLCREGYTNGLKDCDLGGGATFVNVDGKGNFPVVRLTTRAKFNHIDCMSRQCVIGAAPLPTTSPPAIVNANTATVRVGFQGSAFKGGAVAARPTTTSPSSDTDGPSTTLWLVTIGVLVLGGATVAAAQHRKRQPTRR